MAVVHVSETNDWRLNFLFVTVLGSIGRRLSEQSIPNRTAQNDIRNAQVGDASIVDDFQIRQRLPVA